MFQLGTADGVGAVAAAQVRGGGEHSRVEGWGDDGREHVDATTGLGP